MTMVSITEAAKLAGISRNHFYKKYLNTGTISVSRNEAGKVSVDTTELMRVFSTLHREQKKSAHSDSEIMQNSNTLEAVLLEKIKGLEMLLKAKNDELEGYKDREKYFLLENRQKKKRWFGLSKNI